MLGLVDASPAILFSRQLVLYVTTRFSPFFLELVKLIIVDCYWDLVIYYVFSACSSFGVFGLWSNGGQLMSVRDSQWEALEYLYRFDQLAGGRRQA